MIGYFIIATAFLIIAKLFLAGKDSSSYLLKDKNATGSLVKKRIQRWHRDGVALDVIITAPTSLLFKGDWWQIWIVSGLLRLALYDLAFNHWSKLNIHFLGSTAWFDQFFAKIFGQNGAIKKSAFFGLMLIVFLATKVIFKF